MSIQSAFRGGGLSSLTALNQQIIAQVDQGTIAEEAAEEALLGPAEGAVADPDEEVEEPEVRGRFSTENPLEFNRVKEWIELNIFGGESTGMTPLINAFVNEWDVEYRRSQGLDPDQSITAGATLDTLLNTEGFINGALWLPLTATNSLPPVFESVVKGTDGTDIPVVAVSNPLTGVEFVQREELPARPELMVEMARRGSDVAVDVLFNRVLGGRPEAEAEAEPEEDGTPLEQRRPAPPRATPPAPPRVGGRRGLAPPGAAERGPGGINLVNWVTFMRPAPGMADRPLPVITQSQLVDALQSARGGGGGRRGGGGGGGGVRRELVFDRDHLLGQVADLYNRWMLDPGQAPPSLVEGIVDTYIREARAFWSGQGGQLDFDTFVRDKLRGQARYRQIYEHKTPGQSEEAFLQSFMQPISQLGQTAEFTRSQTFSAATSGAGPSEQLKRVMRTPEMEVGGGFSRKLAQTLAGIGVGG